MMGDINTQGLARKKGILLVLVAATLWGVSGSVSQYLFERHQFSAEWLTVARLLLSGLIILSLAYKKYGNGILSIWQDKQDRLKIIIFGIVGTLAIQYTYLAAIQHGNAATATILQYLSPVIITCYLIIISKRLPRLSILFAVLFAILGTFMLVTGGSLQSLSISGWAVFWGLSSAFAAAFYTLYPRQLLTHWDATVVVGWGMLIGGVFFSFFQHPWNIEGQWSLPSLIAFLFIIVFGTALAFYLYLESLKYLSATEVSVLGSAEPLSAAFLAVVWLHVPFGFAEWFGTLCIIGTIILLTWIKER